MRITRCLAAWLLLGCTTTVTPETDGGENLLDARVVDAAAQGDAGEDGGATCVDDEACDDGLFCNGEERCDEGRCAAGEPPSCDDAIDCTEDTCSERLRECVSEPPDADEDGVADAACLGVDGLPLGQDCDDADDNRFPGNPEVCDAEDHDEDCDPTTYGAVDADSDLHDDAACCNSDGETRYCGDDCDDTRAQVYASAAELCDDLDNDCDEVVDEELTELTFGRDCDGDNFGVAPETPLVDCALPSVDVGCADGRWVPNVTDCDDTTPLRNPGLVEVCDGLDNDCAGGPDDGLLFSDYWPDCDGDTQGDETVLALSACALPSPPACDMGVHVTNNSDCDDAQPGTALGLSEVCDGVDNDCDEEVDEGLTEFEYYPDCDGDGEGDDTASALLSCRLPETPPACADGVWVRNDADCDDSDDTINTAATEVCDYIDNDCDDAVDIGADGMTLRVEGRRDRDRDGVGGAEVAVECAGRDQFVAGAPATDDCDDSNPDIRPNQEAYFEAPSLVECPDDEYDMPCPDGLTCGRMQLQGGFPPLSFPTCVFDPDDTIPAVRTWNYDCNGVEDRPGPGSCTCSPPPMTAACQDNYNYPLTAQCGDSVDYLICESAPLCVNPFNRCNVEETQQRILPCR